MRLDPQLITNADMTRVCSTLGTRLAFFTQRDEVGTWYGGIVRLCLAAFALTGCASVGTIEPDGSLVRHYVGYVKVAVPQAAARGAVYTSDVSVLGLRVGGGIGVGYSRDRQMVIPLDCRLAVLVANQAQLDDAVTRLNTVFGNRDICAVVSPSLETNPTGEKP
jgi:hypothetical protein